MPIQDTRLGSKSNINYMASRRFSLRHHPLLPLGECLRCVWEVRRLRRCGCQDRVWPVIVMSRRSASAREATTLAGAAGCITRSPTARRILP